MRKLAILRSDQNNSCPFGLSIPFGCKNAGKTVDQMIVSNDPEIIENNINLLESNNNPSPCKYTGLIIEDTEFVDCLLEDNPEYQPIVGSPLYYKWNQGVSLVGGGEGGGFPLGYYNDNSIDRSQHTLYNLENLAYHIQQFNKQVLGISSN